MSTPPRITIVTPSFNQAPFLEATIRSVLRQGWPHLQYGVVDGGSTDGSIDIIERYRNELDFTIIERDRGQTEAVNKGLRRATGDVVGWLCSDDLLLPGALERLTEVFADPRTMWAAGGVRVIAAGGELQESQRPCGDFTLAGVLLRGDDRPFQLPQPGVFWRRSLHDTLGLLREDLHFCMDFEWWLRLLRAGHQPTLIDVELAAYRMHEASKTVAQKSGFVREHLVVERAYAPHLPWRERFALMRRLGYVERAAALQAEREHPWRLVARRPWWLLSQQVRAALASQRAA